MNRRLALLRSVGIVTVSTYIEYALGLLMSVWVARALGPADFGRYAFTVWLCGWLIVCSNHALTTSSTKFIAEAEGMQRGDLAAFMSDYFARLQRKSSAAVVVLAGVAMALVQPPEWQGHAWQVVPLVVIAVVTKANYAMMVAVAKGYERFEPEAIATVAGGVLAALLCLGALVTNAGLVDFVALFTVACLTLNLINRMACRRYAPAWRRGPLPDDLVVRVRRHLKLTSALVLMASLRMGSIEIFLLSTFTGSVAVAYFAIAGTLTRGAVQLFSVGLTSTLLPYMARTYGQSGTARATAFLSEATRFYWAVGVAIAGLGAVTTPEIVRIMYGVRYEDAIPAIQATLVLAGLLLVGNGIAAFQTVVDRQDDRVRIGVISLAVNAAAGLALIPPLGLPGAVMTYALSRLVEMALAIHYLRRATAGGLPAGPMARLFAVGLAATVVAYAAVACTPSRWGFVAGAAVFLGVYVPGSAWIRYWTGADVALMNAISHRLGRAGAMLRRATAHVPVAPAGVSS